MMTLEYRINGEGVRIIGGGLGSKWLDITIIGGGGKAKNEAKHIRFHTKTDECERESSLVCLITEFWLCYQQK